jgi:hypothetical protein
MAITSFTVDGSEVTPLIATFEVRETVGGVSTLSCGIVSVGSPVMRYGVFSDVVVVEDGVTIFAGTVTQAREQGVGGPVLDSGGNPQIVTTITAEDHNRIADRVSATETVTAGTLLKAFLTTLVTNYLAAFGVSLDGSQVNGPALPDMSFDISRLTDVLQALADATGYLWRIDYDKKLRMWAEGDLTAPFDINQTTDIPARWGGDVTVETILGDNYANRVIVVSDPISVVGHTETFTGNGVDDSVTLEYTLTKAYGYVTYDGIFQTLRYPDSADAASWTYDASDNSLTRTAGPIQSGKILSITFDGTFSARATAEDAGEIAAHGLYEHIERRSDITTTAAAQAIADALLAQLLDSGEQTVTYTTRFSAPTFRVGQLQTIDAHARDLSGDFIIRDLRVFTETNPASAEGWMTREVTAKQQQVLAGKWQQTYHDWLKVGSGGTATTVGPAAATTATASGPAAPFTSVQFNDEGKFGGDAGFTFDKDSTSAMVGLNHTPAGSENLLVGDGHAVN